MIDAIKKSIENKIGFKIKNRGDCELLSHIILEVIDKEISYNTLRRLYGLNKEVKPNKKTLNILSEFLGYKNYIDFNQKYNYKQKNDLSAITYKVVNNTDENEIIALIKSVNKSYENFVDFIILLVRELFHLNKHSLIDKLFNLPELDYRTFNYSELLHIGNSIGLLLRLQNNKKESLLFHNINFLRCIYLIFVDYSSLNGYYIEWARIIHEKKITREIEFFTGSILQFHNFLNNKTVFNLYNDEALNTQNHPILCGRLLSIKILAKDYNNLEQILDLYYKTQLTKQSMIFDLSYELFITAILIKNIELMRYLVSLNLKYEISAYYYQRSHLNLFYLMCLFYYRLIGDANKEDEYLSLFKLNELRYSYEEFVYLIYLIYLYSEAKNRSSKEIINKKYNKLTKKLNYPYFSIDFLKSYFN